MKDLLQRYRALGPDAQRALIAAMLVLALYAASGLKTAALTSGGLLAVIVVALSHRRKPPDWEPSPAKLRVLDELRARDDADEYEASGAGELAYEHVLRELQALVGQHVTILTGAGGPSWRPQAMLEGKLTSAIDVGDSGDEILFFSVGAPARDRRAGFYLDRRRFSRGEALARRGDDDGLELTAVDGSVIWIHNKTAAASRSE